MKAARTYLFMFVAIPPGWLFQGPKIPGFVARSNGSSPTSGKRNDRSRWGEGPSQESKAQSLPNHLFWTWFVDNPRPPSKLS
jgi:hypothetical protein